MELLKRMLLSNRAWVQEKLNVRSSFFHKMRRGQRPKVLWIGCADSRVPAEEVTGCDAGDLFVHRNIANRFCEDDLSAMSVLEYAVNVLKVESIVVCGHTGCGGMLAAKEGTTLPIVSQWIAPLRQAAANSPTVLDLTKFNILQGVERLSQTPIVQKAWMNRQPLTLTGWLYDTASGLLVELTRETSAKDHSEPLVIQENLSYHVVGS